MRIAKKLSCSKNLTLVVVLYGFFVAEVFYFAFTTIPNFDELSYLFKGYQLALNKVVFLEPFTFWWNKMVLSFSFWGWVQTITSPGFFWVRFVIGILNSLAGFLLIRTVGNFFQAKRQALFVVLMILNFPLLNNWSVANSQVLINFFLSFALYILSARSLNGIRLILLSVFMVLMVLTRENMIFFIPPVIGYIWFRDGWRKSMAVLGMVGGAGALWFILNFPNDLLLLTRFLPFIQYPDFDLYSRFTSEQNQVEDFDLYRMVRSFSYTLRIAPLYYWGAFAASVGLLFGKLQIKEKKNSYVIFLIVSFWFLFLPHVWVTQGLGYCPYCLATYSGFFISLGGLLLIFLPDEKSAKDRWLNMAYWLLLALLTIAFLAVPAREISLKALEREGILFSQFTWLAGLITNKFNLQPAEFRQVWNLIFAASGAFIGVFLLGFFGWILEKRFHSPRNTLTLMLVGLFILSGISDLMIEKKVTACRGDMIRWVEETTEDISLNLPSNPVIFLNGEWAALPLLYLDDGYEYFMPQINSNFSYSKTIPDEKILRFGLWNEPLAQTWRERSNVFLFDSPEAQNFTYLVDINQFQTYNYIYRPGGCETQIELHLFVRKE